MQDNLSKLQIKSNANKNLANINLRLDHKDNYSSEEEIDSQEITQTSFERPLFDRSTKVLRQVSIITENI